MFAALRVRSRPAGDRLVLRVEVQTRVGGEWADLPASRVDLLTSDTEVAMVRLECPVAADPEYVGSFRVGWPDV
jgi:hypothetical protein